MQDGLRSRASVAWALCLALLGCSGGSQSVENESPEPLGTTSDLLVPSPIMGTLGYKSSTDQLFETWDVGDNTLIGGWRLALADKLVKDRIADFDGDNYDDVIVTSNWGMGILGTTASGWTVKAMNSNGTNIGNGVNSWTLSSEDRVAAVGVFAGNTPSTAAMMVLQHKDKGIAFVRINPTSPVLQAVRVVPINGTIIGSGQSWTVRYSDRLFNVGKLQGSNRPDAIAVLSDAGMGVYLPSATVAPTLIARAQNLANKTANGMNYTLHAEDPRLRAYGGDFDPPGDTADELLLTGPSGLAIFHLNTLPDISGMTPWDLRFQLLDGQPFAGTSVKGTLHSLIKLGNYDNSGGVDMLFQTETGISVIGKTTPNTVPWSFSQIASHSYGSAIGFWNFSGNDVISPYVGDVTGDTPPLVDFVFTSTWGLGLGYRSGNNFASHGTTAFGSIPLNDPGQVVGIGKFDRSNKYTLLYKKVGLVTPTKPAVLTYNNDNNRTGVQSKETSLTPSAITNFGLVPAYSDLTIQGGLVDAQVLYVPDVSVNGAALKDLVLVVTRQNRLYQFNAADGAPIADVQFRDIENASRSIPYGIKSTPVVDYDKKIVYLVYSTTDGVSSGAYWLTAWDLQQQKQLRSLKIVGSFPKSSSPGVGDPVWFNPTSQQQRPGLLLHNGSLYVGFGAIPGGGYEDTQTYHGWLFRYEAETFESRGVFNSTPNEGAPIGPPFPPAAPHTATGAGIWQGGGGITADDIGSIYVMTGNGSDNPTLSSFGDSMVRLSPRGYSLQFRGRFGTEFASPGTSQTLRLKDWDFGSGGPTALPGTYRLLGGGKEGKFFLVSSGTFDGQNAPVAQSFQAFTNVFDITWRARAGWDFGPHIHGQPLFWNNYVYHQAEQDFLKAFSYSPSTGALATTPVLNSDGRTAPMATLGGPDYMNGGAALSANGSDTTSGVLWLRSETREDNKTGCGDSIAIARLTAYKAVPQGGTLQCLQSLQLPHAPNQRGFNTSVPPTVAGGKVFVVRTPDPALTTSKISVFKLGTSAPPNRDCPSVNNPTPPPCLGLIFQGGDGRAVFSTGDWAPGSFKGECPVNQAGTGLSFAESNALPDPTLPPDPTFKMQAHSLYCGRFLDNRYAHSTCHSVNFSTDSVGSSENWDPGGFYKGECNDGEYVAGVAQSQPSGALTHILCCTGVLMQKIACSAVIMPGNSNAGEPGANGYDFDPYYWKGECGPNRYLAGVSRVPATGAGHAIYCCGHEQVSN